MGKLIIDGIEVGGSSSASSVKYDNTNSTLVSTNVQGAITELNESLNELNSNLGGLRFGVDGDGNGGYYKADDSFVPFKSGGAFDSFIPSGYAFQTTLDILPSVYQYGNSISAVSGRDTIIANITDRGYTLITKNNRRCIVTLINKKGEIAGQTFDTNSIALTDDIAYVILSHGVNDYNSNTLTFS